MVKALLILAWRDDVGAYILHSFPDKYAEEVDGQDLMNLYNLHRFRSTEKNFQMVKTSGFNAASFYSGGYQSNYIGKPNYCVTLLLDKNENPNDYERVLVRVTNKLLVILDEEDFEYEFLETFEKLRDKRFDEIKVDMAGIQFDKEIVEASTPKKKLATTSSATISDEEKIFQELMESEDLNTSDSGFDSKVSDFEKSTASSDPFGNAAADPFGPTASRDMFAENPFDAAQKPTIEAGLDPTLGLKLFDKKRTTAAEIIARLERMDANKPQEPPNATDDDKYKHLQAIVGFLEEKVNILSTLVKQVKDLENAHDEKDLLIGKLLLLIKGV